MTKLTDGERLVALETNLTNLTKTVEALATDTKQGFADINVKLDVALPSFVTQTEFTQYKSSQNVQKVLLSVLMIIVGALVGFFLSHVTN